MERLGIISGTLNLGQTPLTSMREEFCETDFGHALVFVSDRAVFLPRHGVDPDNHILPHAINHRANMAALRDLGVSEVISFNSTGSLKPSLKPGCLVVPDDFIFLSATPTVFSAKPMHITPALDREVRQRLLRAASECGVDPVNGGVYWQTVGPRLETRAEVRLLAQFADIVGMTMASEAAIANELDMQYASLCSVDNYAHGLVDQPLAMEEIIENARRNRDLIIRIMERYLENRS
jgi:purine nucleoside phosphorylase